MKSPVVTVTGGATGIGAAVVDQLLEQGATVHVLDVAEVEPRDNVHFVSCDLADPASIQAALPQLPDQIDAHCNVAGVAGPTPADWVLKVNFLGLRCLTDSLFERITAGGSVVNVSSSAGRKWEKRRQVVEPLVDTADFETGLAWALENEGRWNRDPYTFSKQCVTLWTHKAAQRGATGAVRINAVSPGGVDTQLTPNFRDQMGNEYSDWLRTFTDRGAAPAEMAEPIVWLAIGNSRWVNGADLMVDRGLEAGMISGWVDLDQAPGR